MVLLSREGSWVFCVNTLPVGDVNRKVKSKYDWPAGGKSDNDKAIVEDVEVMVDETVAVEDLVVAVVGVAVVVEAARRQAPLAQ